MNNISKERVGEIFVLSSSVLWAFFPILTILSYSELGPITSLAWTTLLSLIFFLGIATYRASWVNIFTKELFFPLLGVAITLSISFYALFFFGLQHTSAGNASIIATFEIFFSFLFFNIWRKEFINKEHIWGAILMFIGVIIILFPNFSHIQIGDFFILGAVFIAPLGNLLQKNLREKITSEQIMFFRTLIATPVLFLFAHLLGENISFPEQNTWLILLLNGIVLFGITKILWVESIHRLSVTKAISLSSISPIFTLIFAYLILKDTPTMVQIIAIPFAILGVYLLTRPTIKKETVESEKLFPAH